jgi:hypothetical protein
MNDCFIVYIEKDICRSATKHLVQNSNNIVDGKQLRIVGI